MKKWEYLARCFKMDKDFKKNLNLEGQEGWEAISIIPKMFNIYVVFKREVIDNGSSISTP